MISIITTFRGGDEYRIKNLYAVERQFFKFFPEWEMIIVEQDNHSRLDSSAFSGKPKHTLVENPGLFNKSWGMNVGYKLSRENILVFCDSDILISKMDLLRSVAALNKGLNIVRPFQHLVDLNREQSSDYLNTGRLPEADQQQHFDRTHMGEIICLAGGVFVIRRSFFEQLNGFDERFVGWGGEDDAFSIKAQAATTNSAISIDGMAWHLWHPRANAENNPEYRNNCQLLDQYRRLEYENKDTVCTPIRNLIGRIDKHNSQI